MRKAGPLNSATKEEVVLTHTYWAERRLRLEEGGRQLDMFLWKIITSRRGFPCIRESDQ
jgi:hypothetical protein